MPKSTKEANRSKAETKSVLDELIQQAVAAELAAMLEQYSNVKSIEGRRAVVRNGYLPEREIVTAVGPVKVKLPQGAGPLGLGHPLQFGGRVAVRAQVGALGVLVGRRLLGIEGVVVRAAAGYEEAWSAGAGPLLACGDGAMDFWLAMEEVFPQTKHQRCWFHKMGKVLNALGAFNDFVDSDSAKYPQVAEKLIAARAGAASD